MTASIFSIVYQPKPSVHKEPFQYMRVPVDQATLIANHGIEGDRKAGKSKKRQLNIMSKSTMDKLKADGYKTNPGEMGEQLIIDGLDVASLTKGTRLKLGDDAIIEITKPRMGCEWFEAIQTKTKEVDLGMLATVIEGGVIHVGDTIEVLAQPVPAKKEKLKHA